MPKRVIKYDPNEPIRTERIDGETIGDHANQIVIGWGKGLGMVQIGVQEPGAIPGEREGGHFTTIGREQIGQLIAALRTAERQAYSQPRPEPTIAVVAYVLSIAEEWIAHQENPSLYFAVTPMSAHRIDGRKITGMVDLRVEKHLPSEWQRRDYEYLVAIIRRQIAKYA